MKHLFLALIMSFLIVDVSSAQSKVTKFLGIPVDGTKSEMIKKLKEKGFSESGIQEDILVGQFNGTDVSLFVLTNNDKVCRIMLCDINTVDEKSIQIRFNKLCQQFENNKKYFSSDFNKLIPDGEDISYEMSVNNKRYDALYYQIPEEELLDSAVVVKTILPSLMTKFSEEELKNPTDSVRTELIKHMASYCMELGFNRPVWFMISEALGKYYITMYYDNEYNRANGEDL